MPNDPHPRSHLRFVFRGEVTDLAAFDPKTTLLDWLRVDRRATGTKEGCAEGDCGACTVVLARRREDGRISYEPANACILFLGQVDGAELLTVEDLAKGHNLHPVQQAMATLHGSQCGFCTPGIVMSLFALYQDPPGPVTREVVNRQLAGNLCRCTGYRPIVDAALQSCGQPDAGRVAGERAASLARLEGLGDGRDLFVGTPERFFAAPASEESLCDLLARYPDALLVAGATDVGLWVTKSLHDPARMVWLGRVAGLDAIGTDAEAVAFGATVSHERATEALVGLHADFGPLMSRFGSIQVRVSGTVGGNVANGSPIGDLPPALIAMGADVELAHAGATRRLPLERFFIAYRQQDRRPGEYVRRVLVPRLRPNQRFQAFKVSKRLDEDISAVMAAFRTTLDGRTVVEARAAFGGMAATPKRASRTEAALAGIDLDDEGTWTAALDAIALDFAPLSDQRASAGYRALVARNLLFKALAELRGDPLASTRIGTTEGVRHAAE